MRTTFIMVLLVLAVSLQAQNIKLPAPSKKGGTTTIEALWNRHSTRSFQKKELSKEMLSNLLWASNGINRNDGKRTNPTAMNKQEISIYVFMRDGVYKHDYKSNMLLKMKSGDHRNLLAHGQNYVNDAPVCLLIVSDASALSNIKNNEERLVMLGADAGIVSENINIFCSGNGLATVPRGNMDKDGIKKLLKLGEHNIPLLNNPVGYAK